MFELINKTRTGSWMAKAVVTVTLWAVIFAPRSSQAEPMREFVMSCAYGVLAGSLVGAATLAFTDRPGENLNKVARGASIGLYAGILLGTYVIYGVPSQEEEEMPLGGILPSQPRALKLAKSAPRFTLMPIIEERGLSGGAFRWTAMQF